MSSESDRVLVERVRLGLTRLAARGRVQFGVSVGLPTLWLLFLLFVPVVFLVAVSFTVTSETYSIIWEPTLANYRDLFIRDGLAVWETPFSKALLLSYAIGAVTTLTTMTIAFPVAYVLARRDSWVNKVIIYLVLLPFFTVYLVRAYSWLLMFGQSGVINQTLITTGLVANPVELFDFGAFAVVVGLTHAYFPYMLLTLYASLDGVDFSLIEAARDLGASRIDAFRDVVLPLILPGIVSGAVFVFVPAIGAFVTPQFLARGQLQMVGQIITTRVNSLYAIGYGSAASMFLIISVIVAFVLAFRYIEFADIGGA